MAFMGEKRNACRFIVKKLQGKKPLGIPRRRWEINISTCFQEISCNGLD